MNTLFHLYIDDSGTRNPDRAPPIGAGNQWFALGGIICEDSDEEFIRTAHAEFCATWQITYPLHSYPIRSSAKNFRWLLDDPRRDAFLTSLESFLCGIPVIGISCVIDRAGYRARFEPMYGTEQWWLCKTAFNVVVERSAKFALKRGGRISVFPEECGKNEDRRLKEYFRDLRQVGLPFSANTSAKYSPLTQSQLKSVLKDIKFKKKSSPMAQLADLYLYPMCRAGHDRTYRPYRALTHARRLIDCHLSADEIFSEGVKYSCYDSDSKKSKGPALADPNAQPPKSG